MKIYTRDDTEHGQQYVLRSEADDLRLRYEKDEATGQWYEGRCHADDPITERQWLAQAHKMLAGICRGNKIAALYLPENGVTTAGKFAAELGRYLMAETP